VVKALIILLFKKSPKGDFLFDILLSLVYFIIQRSAMAHSTVPNAGQKYASARKHGVNPNNLQALREVAFTHHHSGNSDDLAKEKERVSELVVQANMKHQQDLLRHW
jgi:hypothetical protein